MVFNVLTSTNTANPMDDQTQTLATDRQTLLDLGGATKVAELLGYDKRGVQRVHNWLSRGIPPKVKIEHPELFLRQTAQTEL